MSEEFSDSVVTHNSRPAGGERILRGSAPIEETLEIDRPHNRGGSGFLETYTDSRADRALPDSVRERIDRIEAEHNAAQAAKNGDAETEATIDEDPKLVAEREGSAAASAKDPAKPIPVAATTTAPAELTADHKAERDRLQSVNDRLVAELEAERSKPREVAAPHKLMTEAGSLYLTDSIGATRRFIAASIGVDDPESKEVNAELAALYGDLTAKELGVTPDVATQAARESARTRQLLERDKRERKAESDAAAERVKAEAETKQADAVAGFIGNRLQTKRDDGRTIADDHPLLSTLSETFDGMKPEKLLATVLQRETKTGRIVLTGDDAKDIATAARLVEDHYTQQLDKIEKLKPKPPSQSSTATPPSDAKSPAAKQSASKETRQSPAARTLTTADASVAPATPPAQKAATETKKPKFRNDKERREWALRHLK